MSYLSVTNFRKHQHYRNRKPPWIKFYVDLLDPHNKLNQLPLEARFLFDRLLLLAAEWDNAIPNDSELLARLVVMDSGACRESIDLLLKGRWLSQRKTRRRVSKTASNGASGFATTEQEAETEQERELEKALAGMPDFTFDEREIEVDRILGYCVDETAESRDVVLFFARQVPLASVVRVRESCRKRAGCGVGYAVNALKDEAKEAA